MKNSKPLKLIFILTLLSLFSVLTFAQADVARQTTAATYPLNEQTTLKFKGTTRFPRMNGSAKIKRTSKNGTEIQLAVNKMPRPFELGAGYATYVLWAISPDGQIDNLGEIKRRGFWEFDSTINVTTPLQTFALIVTAEPHFLVKRPSRAIMLENLSPTTKEGIPLQTAKAIQYFGNSSDYFNDAKTPEIAETDYAKTPSAILQAKQAVALAKYAGAQRDAADELQSAENLLKNADDSWKAGRADDEIDILARQAISAAVKAEDTAFVRREAREKRNERSRQDAELQKSEDKYSDAMQQIENLKFELSRETRNRELVERDAQNYSRQVKELKDENAKLRDELDKAKQEASEIKIKLAKTEGEKEVIAKQKEEEERFRQEEERRNRIQANIPVLMQSLKTFGVVRQTERGIILTLPETYWSGIRVSSFTPTNEPKLSNLANLLAGNPDFKFVVESHTDDKGTPEDLKLLTQERAQAVADKLMSVGVDQSRIEVKGLGASVPVAPNTTAANRIKNRRIELILIPNLN
jgi:outer membrane protein OmpA-like peptidoglycan-associated protein